MNFAELLQELDIPSAPAGHEHSRPGWLNWDCPYCTPNAQHWRMGYNIRYGYVNCWACGRKNLANALAQASGSPIGKIHALLKGVDKEEITRKFVEDVRGKLRLPKGLVTLLPIHRKYLTARGFVAQKIKEIWQLKGTGFDKKYPWSIFIPITLDGETVSFTTRKMNDDGMRYKSAYAEDEAISAKKVLYGADKANQAITIHEGPLDAWAVGQGATATLGLSYTRSQLLQMIHFPRRIVCFDNESAAQRRAEKLCTELECYPGETLNVVLDAKDAASAKPKEINKLREMLQ